LITGIDLDHCRNLETGQAEPWAQQIIDRMNTYTEINPSGTGYHLWALATIPPECLHHGKQGRRQGHIEIYQGGRYLTVTGNHVTSSPIDRGGMTGFARELSRAAAAADDPAAHTGRSL
jgi:putative DNA primase/helicase